MAVVGRLGFRVLVLRAERALTDLDEDDVHPGAVEGDVGEEGRPEGGSGVGQPRVAVVEVAQVVRALHLLQHTARLPGQLIPLRPPPYPPLDFVQPGGRPHRSHRRRRPHLSRNSRARKRRVSLASTIRVALTRRRVRSRALVAESG
eukprot:769758-Prorocentrum_minimum.AAC.1